MKLSAEHGRQVLPVPIHIVHTTQLARLHTAVTLTAHTLQALTVPIPTVPTQLILLAPTK